MVYQPSQVKRSHKEKERDCESRMFFYLKEKTFNNVKREGALLNKDRNTVSKITSGRCITSSAVLEQMIKHARNQKKKSPEAY